jgi:ABC-type amino acid transport substrate-binding protein
MRKQSFSITRFIFVTLFIITVTLICSYLQVWANEPVRVGIFQNKPIVYFEDGPQGLFVDVLDHVAKKEGWELEYVTCELKECFNLLKSNELDLMTSLGRSPGRSELLTFSKESIWTFWGTIYSHDLKITGILGLEGQKIGVRRKNKITLALQKLLTDFNISVQYVEFDNYESAFKAFDNHTIDAVAVNNTYGFDKQKEINIFKTPIVFNPFSAYFAAPKNGRHNDKLTVIDHYVKELRGTIIHFFIHFRENGLTHLRHTGQAKELVLSALFFCLLLCAPWHFGDTVQLSALIKIL